MKIYYNVFGMVFSFYRYSLVFINYYRFIPEASTHSHLITIHCDTDPKNAKGVVFD